MKIAFAGPAIPKIGTLVVGVGEERLLTPEATALDRDTGGALVRAMAASRFTGKTDQLLSILAPGEISRSGGSCWPGSARSRSSTR